MKIPLALRTRIPIGEADPNRGRRVLMAEGPAAHPTDDTYVISIPAAVDTRKEKFGQILKVKLEQGYRIESQSETEAVVFTRGRRSWFGLFAGPGEGGRQMISVDAEGAATTRKLTPDETSES